MRSLVLWRAVGLAALLAVVALIPLDGNIVLTQVGVLVLLYVGSAVAWNIFSGFTGYISLGAAVFFGVGVYTVALISKHLNLVGGVVFALYPVGGLGSIGGALGASVLVITLASLVDVYWNPEWSTVVFYGAMVLVLVFRPQRLFGRKEARAQ